MKIKWLCKFRHDDWEDATECEEPDEIPRWAAEAFAKYAFDHRDMWEHDNSWGDEDHAVIVKSPITGEEFEYEIEMEFNPAPYAEQIIKEEKTNEKRNDVS